MSVIIFLIVLAALILVHEFGHFIVAKRAGIRVDEFGLGFPPRLGGTRKGETTYSVNAIPFGGFVKIFGEDPSDEALHGPDAERSFLNKGRLTQAAVIGAGIAFNVFFAWALLSASLALGVPASVDGSEGYAVHDPHVTITSVVPGAPAHGAGLTIGDRVLGLSVKEENLDTITVSGVQQFITGHPDQELTLSYERRGERAFVKLVPVTGIVSDKPAIGISMDTIGIVRLSAPKAILEGGKLTFDTIGFIAVGFFTLVADAVRGAANLSDVSGPVGIVSLVGDAASLGFSNLLRFTALISINLAIINLLPLPALDGGRLLFIAIEAIKRSPLNPKFVNWANTIGFALLILLMLVVTYSDVAKLL